MVAGVVVYSSMLGQMVLIVPGFFDNVVLIYCCGYILSFFCAKIVWERYSSVDISINCKELHDVIWNIQVFERFQIF